MNANEYGKQHLDLSWAGCTYHPPDISPFSLSFLSITLSAIPFHSASLSLTHCLLPSFSSAGLHGTSSFSSSSSSFFQSSVSYFQFLRPLLSIKVDSLKYKEQQLPIHLTTDWDVTGRRRRKRRTQLSLLIAHYCSTTNGIWWIWVEIKTGRWIKWFDFLKTSWHVYIACKNTIKNSVKEPQASSFLTVCSRYLQNKT